MRVFFHSSLLLHLFVALGAMGLIPSQAEEFENGLIGPFFGDADFQRAKGIEVLHEFEKVWPEGDGHGADWSAEYEGSLIPPASGEVTFYLKSNRKVEVSVDGKAVVEVSGDRLQERSGVARVQEGKEIPFRMTIRKIGDEEEDVLALSWSWENQGKQPIPGEAVRHRKERYQEIEKAFPELVEPAGHPPEIEVPATHTIVYAKSGMFAGWPANNGVWVWGNEILVGFVIGGYLKNPFGHSIDKSTPSRQALARSLDGGNSWSVEYPEELAKEGMRGLRPSAEIDFSHPDLALRCKDDSFHASIDRGKTWNGPFPLIDIGRELTSRTDYRVTGRDEGYFFLSAKYEEVQSGLQDRAFCAVTRDGGKTFAFLSWMTGEPVTVRSVMPSTVRTGDDRFVSLLRRRIDNRTSTSEQIENWIDAYGSLDGGKTWTFLSKVADTDTGKNNGNPPSLVRLRDGTLCVTYGYRATPYGIRAKISKDEGKSWGKEIGVRTDASSSDIGYTRSVVRDDGKVVTIYYYATQDRPEQHIAASIWDPAQVGE